MVKDSKYSAPRIHNVVDVALATKIALEATSTTKNLQTL